MKFFNLRYECLDAQDNFHAELINGENGYSFGEMDNDIYNERSHLDDIKDNEEDELDGYNHDHIHIGRFIGKATKTMFSKMESMENIMKASGWFDKSPDGLPNLGNLDHVEPSIQLSSKEWQNKINEKRQQLLQVQMSIESNQDDDDIDFDQYDTQVFNDVKAVD